jgi:2-amino-4-hydroxy-6-hydroxymethyldihydropteridine diphosphokinase/dihydropteroate synthase
MAVYLGLGSNLGDRRAQLARAISELRARGVRVSRISPVVESPALLPAGAAPDWNLPYLNLAVECEIDAEPGQVLAWIAEIERAAGREASARWAPRPIDIDILLWGDRRIDTPALTIPHRELARRQFVLTPLVALAPRLEVPGPGRRTVLDCSIELGRPVPLWMGIVNVTPDSFSDGGRLRDERALDAHVAAMFEAGAHILDVGGESTRPGATPVEPDEEWRRLAPVLERLIDRHRGAALRPLVSVDTYHPETARRALALGVDMINDVGGLTAPEMIELAQDGGADWVAMHNLSVPADPAVTLPPACDPVAAVGEWLAGRIDAWDRAGLDLNRIVFDPGIGFGKNALQSLALLRGAERLRRHGLRVLIGHSRKSFMKSFSSLAIEDKDLATVGASLSLCARGVDILRVHNVPLHAAAYRGWSHLEA